MITFGVRICAFFFAGLDLIDPGVVPCPQWRPDPSCFETLRIDAYCGVGRKVR